MRSYTLRLALGALLMGTAASSTQADVHVGIGVGIVPPVVVPPPTYYAPPPAYYTPPPPIYYGPGVVYGYPGWEYGGPGWRDPRWHGRDWGHDRWHGDRGRHR